MFDGKFIVVKMEAVAATFTFVSFDGLSTVSVDFLYHKLEVNEKGN